MSGRVRRGEDPGILPLELHRGIPHKTNSLTREAPGSSRMRRQRTPLRRIVFDAIGMFEEKWISGATRT